MNQTIQSLATNKRVHIGMREEAGTTYIPQQYHQELVLLLEDPFPGIDDSDGEPEVGNNGDDCDIDAGLVQAR